MIKHFAFFILLFFSILFKAQSVFNTTLIKKLAQQDLSEKIRVFMMVKPNTDINFSDFKEVTFHYKAGAVYSVTSDLNSIKQLAALKNVLRIEYTVHHLQLMADTCILRNRIKDIHAGTAPLTQPYDGTGVIVGIVDSGTDFTHPDFKDANGKSRINFLWDMNKPVAANTPATFGYGQEWSNTDIDAGLCTHDDLADYGHGTASSGIAAGNGLAINKYAGMAPKADIIVVALDFTNPVHPITDAMQYIFTKAQLAGKPVVINASVGDYGGSHDGTDLETQLINNLVTATPGRALIASAGNAGNIAFHVGYQVTSTDTNFTWISDSGPIEVDEYADTAQIKNVKFTVGVNNPGFTDLGRLSFKPYNYALNIVKKDTLYHNMQRIGIIETVAGINTFGVYNLNIKITSDSANYLWRIEHTGSGRIDSWNFDYVTSGLPGSSQYPKIINYKRADTAQTIVGGFQCSNEVITVANYVNRNQYIDVNGTTQITSEVPGAIAASSSIGPSRDNKIKPDITASGATILTSAALGLIPNLIANAPQVVAQGGYHITAGGTSASSPVVAGMVALYLQKNPTATNRQIKQAIINCAYNDVFTTQTLPNTRWGNGKLDGFKTMTCNDLNTGIAPANEETFEVYPNPLTNETTIAFHEPFLKTIKLYSASGQLVFSDICSAEYYTLKKNNFAPGLYLLLSEAKSGIHKVKILIL